MEPLVIAGLVHFNDTVAARASQGGIVCSGGPCELAVPPEGRVLSFESESAIDGVTISGGSLTIHCTGEKPPLFQLTNVRGDIHVADCAMSTCENFHGTLKAEWNGHAHCTRFEGTLITPGESNATVEGSGILLSGGTAYTTLVGPKWAISGTGSVDFGLVDDFTFEGGTAGITVLDWSWMSRPQLTIWEFASEAPIREFYHQTIEVVGGWPEGSTVTSCTISGTLGHIPVITNSVVFSAEHSYGPVVSIVKRTELNGNIRADGYVFLNDVSGDISVVTETTFVNKYTGGSDLLIDGPHKIICSDCGVVLPYDDSITVAETDLLITSELTHDIDMGGHTALLGSPPEARVRRDEIQVNGSTTSLPSASSTTIVNGNVVLIEDINVPQAETLTISGGDFTFGDHTVTVMSGSTFNLWNCHVNGKLFDSEPPVAVMLSSEAELDIENATIDNFLWISSTSAAEGAQVYASAVNTTEAGGIAFATNSISVIEFCGVFWANRTSDLQYVYTSSSTTAFDGSNFGNEVCLYAGDSQAVLGDNGTCSTFTQFNQTLEVTEINQCLSSTTIVTTTTTVPATTTTTLPTTAPRPASSSSSSSLNDSEIAAIVVGSVIAAALLISGIVIFARDGDRIPGYSFLKDSGPTS
jgi:hypothetical protein